MPDGLHGCQSECMRSSSYECPFNGHGGRRRPPGPASPQRGITITPIGFSVLKFDHRDVKLAKGKEQVVNSNSTRLPYLTAGCVGTTSSTEPLWCGLGLGCCSSRRAVVVIKLGKLRRTPASITGRAGPPRGPGTYSESSCHSYYDSQDERAREK